MLLKTRVAFLIIPLKNFNIQLIFSSHKTDNHLRAISNKAKPRETGGRKALGVLNREFLLKLLRRPAAWGQIILKFD